MAELASSARGVTRESRGGELDQKIMCQPFVENGGRHLSVADRMLLLS